MPAATLMCGGKELGDIDVGYGPARLLSVDEVISFDRFLFSLHQLTFLDGLNVESFRAAELYSMEIQSIEELEVFWDRIKALRGFIHEAKDRSECIVLHLY